MEEINDNLIKLLNEFNIAYSRLKQSLPYHLNVIDELHINENAHSRILCKLLLFRSDTGEYEILQSLIKYISRYNKAFDGIIIKSPEITQELERIDIWVKDKEGGYAIIFENKVYDANDQEAQIARYIKKTRNKFDDNQIFVVYMPSVSDYEPSSQTWEDNETGESLYDKFKNRYAKVSFDGGVLPWLKENVLPNIRVKDGYLHSALLQYIDYLEGRFDKRNNNKKTNMEIKRFLDEEFEKACAAGHTTSEEDKLKWLKETELNIEKLLIHVRSSIQAIEQEKNDEIIHRLNNSRQTIHVIADEVARELNMKCEFLYNEENSDFWIRYYKEGWILSIIIEKYHLDHCFFTYIGIPTEVDIQSNYPCLYPEPKINLFKHFLQSEKATHPYGYDYLKYNSNIEKFLEEINNGEFKEYLKKHIRSIREMIEERQIKMG